MNAIIGFLERHWLSLTLLLGALAAVWFVWKNRSKLFDNRPI